MSSSDSRDYSDESTDDIYTEHNTSNIQRNTQSSLSSLFDPTPLLTSSNFFGHRESFQRGNTFDINRFLSKESQIIQQYYTQIIDNIIISESRTKIQLLNIRWFPSEEELRIIDDTLLKHMKTYESSDIYHSLNILISWLYSIKYDVSEEELWIDLKEELLYCLWISTVLWREYNIFMGITHDSTNIPPILKWLFIELYKRYVSGEKDEPPKKRSRTETHEKDDTSTFLLEKIC